MKKHNSHDKFVPAAQNLQVLRKGMVILMILVNGKIIESDQTGTILPTLEKRLCKTLQKPVLNPMVVVEACHRLALRIENRDYPDFLTVLLTEGHVTEYQLDEVVNLFKKESLLYKLKTELGEFYPADYPGIYASTETGMLLSPPYDIKAPIQRCMMPLGVLFHIAAGNVDGLPAYSVIEGLLAGNINILKLPAADQGFTLRLLNELLIIEPLLSEYLYVFDTSSQDIASLRAMAKSADAIVVWGGDEAILAARRLATPNTKIIEWGHKISFAYITRQGMEEQALSELAHHILLTKQLLCSSCQGIYLDTEDLNELHDFSRRFLTILDRAAEDYPRPDIGIQAQLTLLRYNKELEAAGTDTVVYRGKHCCVLAGADRKLEVSITHGNCWIKALPHGKIISTLHRYKGYLQTVGLLCSPQERRELSLMLHRAGVTRVTHADDMSRMLCGESHDGEYPLRRYSKIVEF
jgi:hypothetical protein